MGVGDCSATASIVRARPMRCRRRLGKPFGVQRCKRRGQRQKDHVWIRFQVLIQGECENSTDPAALQYAGAPSVTELGEH